MTEIYFLPFRLSLSAFRHPTSWREDGNCSQEFRFGGSSVPPFQASFPKYYQSPTVPESPFVKDPETLQTYRDITTPASTDLNALENNPENSLFDLSKCLVCSEKLYRPEMRRHLLFGSVACSHCPWEATSCRKFAERHTCRYGCQHISLKWSYAKLNRILKEPNKQKVVFFLVGYLDISRAFQFYDPWKDAYNAMSEEYNALRGLQRNVLQHSNFTQLKKADVSTTAGNGKLLLRVSKNKIRDTQNSCNIGNENNPTGEPVYSRLASPCDSDSKQPSQKPDIRLKFTVDRSKYCEDNTLNNSHAPPLSFTQSSSKKSNPEDKRYRVSLEPSRPSLQIRAKKVRKSPYDEIRPHIPSYALKNHVIVLTLRDDCPQCCRDLSMADYVAHVIRARSVMFRCQHCDLFIFFRVTPENGR